MRETQFRRCLAKFPVSPYLQDARARGLSNLNPELRTQAVDFYRAARAFRRKQPWLRNDVRQMLDFIERALAPEWELARRGEVNYPSYAHIALLEWTLGTDRRTAYDAIWANCRTTFHIVLDDLLSFERDALAGRIRRRDHFRADVVERRVELLQSLASRLALQVGSGPAAWTQEPPGSWEAYTREGVVRHWLALPLTLEHDEYYLLRSVHLMECCWWGALTALIAALESSKRMALEQAADNLARAASFAELMPAVFQVFKKTMPAEHFQSFRLATDKASAIQSRTYQQLQIFLQGVDINKVAVLGGMRETADLPGYQHSGFWHLRQLVDQLRREPSPAGAALLDRAAALDRALYSWRQLHLSKARATLPPGTLGTGGVGIEYLESHVRHRLLSPTPCEDALAVERGAARCTKMRPVFAPSH
jgi:tryptophan 2,3-dioxygenase